MDRLRRARRLASFLLVWFALYLGVALAAHAVGHERMEMVCSGDGVMKLLLVDDSGVAEHAAVKHFQDCRLCVLADAPPPAPALVLPTAAVVAPAERVLPAFSVPPARAFRARGPPLLA